MILNTIFKEGVNGGNQEFLRGRYTFGEVINCSALG